MMAKTLAFLLICCLNGSTAIADTDTGFTLYLVRHAEKQQDGSDDPALTHAGEMRSQQLANWLKDKEIEVIWSSDYQRTRNTARPVLKQLGLSLDLYDPGEQAGFARNLLAGQNNALVVGHSNTIPELARLLCECTITDMDESEHDRLIVIAVINGVVTVETLQQNLLF